MNFSPDLKTRILEAARREESPTRRSVRAATLYVLTAAAAFGLAVFFALGGVHVGARPPSFVSGTAFGWCALGLTSAWFAFTRGGSMLGRTQNELLLTALATPSALFACMLMWNVRFPETLAVSPGRIGLRCLAFTLVVAAWPVVALARVRRERNPAHPLAAGAARGVAAGALAGVLVDLWCPIANPAHVVLGHIVPMLLLMALGALAGRALNGVRR